MSAASGGGKPPRGQGPGIRVSRKRGYTLVFNDEFQPGMSMDAWGLYCLLRLKPDGWEARVYALQQEFKEGRDAIYAALQELVERSMVAKEEYREGNLRRHRYVLDSDAPSSGGGEKTCRSAPDTDSQDPDAPAPDSAGPEDPTQVSKDLGTTDLRTTDLQDLGAAASGIAGDDHEDPGTLFADPAPPTARTPTKANAPRGSTPVPDYFAVTPEMRQWAASKRLVVDVDAATEEFLLHHRAKGTTFRDWVAGWRTWMLRTRQYGGPQSSGVGVAPAGHGVGPRPSRVDAELADLMERRRQRHAAREGQVHAQGGRA